MSSNFIRFTLTLLLIVYAGAMHAQHIVRGTVADSLGKPVPFAQVILLNQQKNLSAAYTMATSAGEYSIKTHMEGSFYVEVRALGYRSKSSPITIRPVGADSVIVVNFRLFSQPLEITEVVIAADKPIVVKRDTIVYNTLSFRKGNESVAEDILKTLPGINVEESGKVTFFNKEVERIMVEGDDLFNKGYRMISRNLPASMVDKVEVYQRYSAKALLKGIEDSDKVALNITLRKDGPLKVFGRATLGLNSLANYEGKTTLMSFRPKVKFYLFANANSLGYTASNDVSSFINPTQLDDKQRVVEQVNPDFILQLYESRPWLRRASTDFGTSQMVSLSSIVSPSKYTKIKVITLLDRTNSLLNKSEHFSVMAHDVSFSRTEEHSFTKGLDKLLSNVDITYAKGSKEFEYSGYYTRLNNTSESNLLIEDTKTSENLRSTASTTSHSFTFTNRYTTRSALQVIAHYLYDNRPERYSANAFEFQGAFPQLPAINSTGQSILSNYQDGGAVVRLLTRYSDRFNLDSRIQFQTAGSSLASAVLFTGDNGTVYSPGDEFTNGVNLRYSTIGVGSSAVYTKGVFSLVPGLNAYKYFVSITDRVADQTDSQSPQFISPSLTLRARLSQLHLGAITVAYNATTTTLGEASSGFILSNHRSLRAGLGSFALLPGSSAMLTYQLGNLVGGNFQLSTSTILNHNSTSVASKLSINPNFSFSQALLGGGRTMLMNTSSLSYFVRPISSNLKLVGNFMGMEYENTINGQRATTQSNSYGYGLELRSGFMGFFNFHFGTHWTVSQIRPSLLQSKHSNRQFLDLLFRFKPKRISGEVRMERLYYSNMESPDNPWVFIDARCIYDIKPNKFKLTASANNLMGYRTFGNYNISEHTQSATIYPLVNRYVMLSVELSF